MTEVLGIEHPIVLGGMAWITKAKLVAAVANAGATGMLGAGGRDSDWVRNEIRKTRELTDRPFGVNIPLDLDKTKMDAVIAVILEEKIPFVSLGAGDPRPYIPRFHAAGVKVISIVPNLKIAKRMAESGADLLVIEGMESGGHIGKLTTMALMTNILPEIDTPTAAAGGIVDGRGLAAALLMGADGVQMGSRFLLAEECEVYPGNVQAIINATDTDTVTTGWSRGSGLRGLKSPFSDKYLELETGGAPMEQLNSLAIGCSRRVAEQGLGPDGMNGIIQVGESLVPLRSVQSAAEIIQEIMAEAQAILKNAPQLVTD